MAITINDHLRIYGFYKYEKGYYISLFAAALVGCIVAYFVHGYMDIYMFMILYEIILYNSGKIAKVYFLIDVLMIMSVATLRQVPSFKTLIDIAFWKENLFDIMIMLASIAFYSLVGYSYKVLYKEKAKVEKLNNKLEESYKTLKEQSEEIEKLTVEKERNRVAQEIHDYLGHSLVALNMNLDVAANIIERDPKKAKDIIVKSKNVAKDSMDSLRLAVYALRDKEKHFILKESIEKLIENISHEDKISVDLQFDENVEKFPPEYKNIIYRTVQEALTNGITHGKANRFNINIYIKSNQVHFTIEDNGVGCKEIVKGNGLYGIEDRINSIGGHIRYTTKAGSGFKIKAIIS
ncbi:sensor histidine kinase [Anaerosalibacter sp. Marseille-P3206]|uniref:sensor histidine kinase n=1 Tax=Anaerosalibacter sp. Marseille-P3206 TaxID=1871005 RepID=UPI0013566BF3|nr:sensor histidine kinase [Anaerosalibacter sp. Marseille-P3206]